MSETNQEEVLQNENNSENNENDLQIDQNHEEDAEVHADGENIVNPETLDQQYTNQEEEEIQYLNQKNEEEDFHHEEQNENEEKEQEQEHEEQEQEHIEQELGNEEPELGNEEPELGNEEQELGNEEQELGNEEQELEHEGQELEHEEQELEHEEQELEHEEQELEHEEQEPNQEEQELNQEEQEPNQEEQEPNQEAIPVIKTEKSLKELQAELEKAISQLDFVRAQEIQEEIEGRSTQNHSQFLDDYAKKFTKECNKVARKHYKEKNSLQESCTRDEIAERTNMKNGFQEMKSLHIDQLQKLENELFNIYKEKMKKPIANYDELIERAKKTARRGDFSSAQDYQQQAKYAKDAEEQKREELFKEEYKARMAALLDKQSQEISDFAFISNNAINKVLKIRDDKLDKENERFKREMNRLYRKTCDTITHSRYNPRDPKQQSIDPKVKPSLLNRIEDTYNDLLVKFGIQSEEGAKKPKMIAPNIRPESKMSARMQSRVEMRETEKKKKEDEHYSRSNSRMSSRAASRNGSKQVSPKQSPRSNHGNNNNNSRRSVLSPSKF